GDRQRPVSRSEDRHALRRREAGGVAGGRGAEESRVAALLDEAARAHARADPRAPTEGRRARRTAPDECGLAATRPLGRPAGENAARRAALDPRARRGHQLIGLGAPSARPGMWTAL